MEEVGSGHPFRSCYFDTRSLLVQKVYGRSCIVEAGFRQCCWLAFDEALFGGETLLTLGLPNARVNSRFIASRPRRDIEVWNTVWRLCVAICNWKAWSMFVTATEETLRLLSTNEFLARCFHAMIRLLYLFRSTRQFNHLVGISYRCCWRIFLARADSSSSNFCGRACLVPSCNLGRWKTHLR